MKRELMQAVWMLLLDEDLMKAYEHGETVLCSDGVKRLIFPRFFVYSADYPEKYFTILIHVIFSDSLFQSSACDDSLSSTVPMPSLLCRKGAN
jgi:hypothetical protein